MNSRALFFIGLVCSSSCVDRKIEPAEHEPTLEEICVDVCDIYDRCWEKEDYNPYGSIPECIDDCVFLYNAWPYDPDGRYHCADVILDLQQCYGSLATCEEFDAVTSNPASPCSEEFSAYSLQGCIGGADPRDYVDTETGD